LKVKSLEYTWEHDVPFAAMAFKDLEDSYYHLTQLSSEYNLISWNQIRYYLQGEFINSPLHLTANVNFEVKPFHLGIDYDLVVDMAMLKSSTIDQVTFSKYKCKNNCYFNIRSTDSLRNSRTVYIEFNKI
jgi:glucan biosynthesis protein